MRFQRNLIPVVLGGLIAVLLLAACGAGGTPGPAYKVIGTEFKFEPASITVTAGEKVKITVENKGALEHDWTLLEADGQTPLKGDDGKAIVIHVAPGVIKSIEFTAPKAGRYVIICSIPGHKEAGMTGELIVK